MYEKKPVSDRFMSFLDNHWILGLIFGLTCFIVGGYICIASLGMWTISDADNMSSIGNPGAGVWIGGGVGITGLLYAIATAWEGFGGYRLEERIANTRLEKILTSTSALLLRAGRFTIKAASISVVAIIGVGVWGAIFLIPTAAVVWLLWDALT